MQHAVAIIFVLIAANLAAVAAERLKFWNLTGFTIKELHLAPAGTEDWGGRSVPERSRWRCRG